MHFSLPAVLAHTNTPCSNLLLPTRERECIHVTCASKHIHCLYTRIISAPSAAGLGQWASTIKRTHPPSPLLLLLQHTNTLLMWCPFHCWMPCCCPQRYIHPAMMSVLGSHSNSQLVHSFKASTIHCIIIGQPVLLEASLCLLSNHAIKRKITRKILGSGQLERYMCGTCLPLLHNDKQQEVRISKDN